ncbi:MAG: hypothetical protein JRI85_17290 [Deltaproteobacteria bacterium]|nr:hypothetical protein [Deltaproteobacteria bacterium]
MPKVAGSVDELSVSVKTGVLPEIDSVLKNVNGTIAGIDNTVNSFRQNLEGILKRVDISLENVRQTTEDLKKASSGMPEILDQSDELMGKTGQIIDSVQGIWLFRPKPENPDSKTLKMDSYE